MINNARRRGNDGAEQTNQLASLCSSLYLWFSKGLRRRRRRRALPNAGSSSCKPRNNEEANGAHEKLIARSFSLVSHQTARLWPRLNDYFDCDAPTSLLALELGSRPQPLPPQMEEEPRQQVNLEALPTADCCR